LSPESRNKEKRGNKMVEKKKLKIVIVGGTETGVALANNMSSKNHEVVIITRDPQRAKDVSRMIDALVINGDGTKIEVLRDAGVPECDAMVSCMREDKDSLMACMIAKSMKVPKVVAVVNDPRDEELFTKLEIKNIVSVVGTNVKAVSYLLYLKGEERVVASFGHGEVEIIQVAVGEESKIVGKDKNELKNTNVCFVDRHGEFFIPDPKFKFEVGDLLTLALKTEDANQVTKKVAGK
jgi:trk system potassium uptake protein TrkA